jgi:mRNA interferase MazF
MQDFRRGEVVLIAFPFADASGAKRRPALVILDTGDQDPVVARLTSQPAQTAFDVEIEHWREARLVAPSVVRMHRRLLRNGWWNAAWGS